MFDAMGPTQAVRAKLPVTRSMMRKFAEFWPKGASGPPQLPWIGALVSRKKAWRWVSQFPSFLSTVRATDMARITRFVAHTLQDVDPTVQDERGDKTCCKKRDAGDGDGPRRLPDFGDDLPDSFEDCWDEPVLCQAIYTDAAGKEWVVGTEPATARCCWDEDMNKICSNPCSSDRVVV